jgi:two-component system NarL family sensor kinase
MTHTSLARRGGFAVGAVVLVLAVANLVALLLLDRRDLLLSPDAVLPLIASLVALVVLRALPTSPIGWLLVAAAASSAVFGASALLVAESPDLPGLLLDLTAWLSTWVWLPSYLITFWFIPLLFPDGRAASARWRPVVRVSAALLVVESLLLAFGTRESIEPEVGNPWAVEPVAEVLVVVEPVIYISMMVLVVLGLASLLHRFVRSQGLVRVQVLCVLVAAAVGVAYYLLMRSGLLLAVLLPVAIGVAVLRFRLYDVERLLGRTIVYGGLAGTATLLYVALVLVAGGVFGADRDLTVQATGIFVSVLLIHPLRDRFLTLAQRLVHGRRSGPYETLAQLARQVGSAMSPDEALPRMAEGIAAALRTRSVRVTATAPNGASQSWHAPVEAVEAEDEAAAVVRRVVHHGVEVGSLRVVRDAPLTAQESGLLEVLVAQAGPSLHAVALTMQLREQLAHAVRQAEELRSSRSRIVTAHDAARRGIERDLHDGAQQGLLALAVQLGRVQRKVGEEPAEAAVELGELQELARRTLVELRALAAGTYPSGLRELGLAAALREQTDRAPQRVVVHDELTDRLSPELETALYFTCMEAVTNAQKHANASQVDVRLTQAAPECISFTVTDDGCGFDAVATPRGNGLVGMADRLGAFGGEVVVASRLGTGTTVTGTAYEPAARYSSTA